MSQGECENKRNYENAELPNFIEAQKCTLTRKNGLQPRWHNQAFMLFLALRQHSEPTMPRIELIKTALAIDKKISEERHLPKVFRGKVKKKGHKVNCHFVLIIHVRPP